MGLQVGATTPSSIVPLTHWLCEKSVAVLLTVLLDCWVMVVMMVMMIPEDGKLHGKHSKQC